MSNTVTNVYKNNPVGSILEKSWSWNIVVDGEVTFSGTARTRKGARRKLSKRLDYRL